MDTYRDRLLQLVRRITAIRVIYLDAILYFGGGLIGTAHHWYFTGQTEVAMALGATFSALEVVPLTLLTLDAWDFYRLTYGESAPASRHRWTFYFLMAVGFWNFVGAGVFGFLINLPIVSYFEVGTTLTSNHGHAALFGVFGMLALAVLVFCLRALARDEVWARAERWIRMGFWGMNAGLALMMAVDLFPAGVLQLWDVLQNGYWHARRLTFLMSGTFHTLEWVRVAGDTVFIVLGALPIALGALRAFLSRELEGAR
jgi:nitric oxide reductase subunit B